MAIEGMEYEKLLNGDSDLKHNAEEQYTGRCTSGIKRAWKDYYSLLYGFMAFISIMLIALLFVGLIALRELQQRSVQCIDVISEASPVTEDVEISFHVERFNGSFLKENVYRKQGSPEVDEAWEALGVNYRSFVVPAELAKKVGLASDQVKVNEKYGGGFPANIEGLHHLHCLKNLVRQALYYNYDYYRSQGNGAFQNNDVVVRKHVSHCLDIIRQQLMCSVDIGVLGQIWWQPEGDQYPEAFVDFNTNHVCRNFEEVRRWAKERQIAEEVPEDFLQPPEPGDTIYRVIP